MSSGGTRGVLSRCLLCVLLLAALSPGLQAQEIPAGFEQALFEIRIPNVASATELVLTTPDGDLLLPVIRVIELTGLQLERQNDSLVFSVPEVGGGSAVLDVPGRRLRLRDRTLPLAEKEVVAAEGQVYLSTARIQDLLRARVDVDWSSLQALVSRNPPFPVEQRMRTAQRRAAAELRAARADGPEGRGVPYPARSGGAVVQWGVATSGLDPLEAPSGRAEVGLAVLGGDLSLGGSLARSVAGRPLHETRWSYRRIFPFSPLLRQVEVGDVLMGGLQLRPARGFTIGNSPLVRDLSFSEVLVRPDVPPGWSFEVYQDGQLLGYAEASERGPVRVPLRYGSTPVQVRMLSPAGEEVTAELLYQVPLSQLAPGRWEYSAGAGRCPRGGCGGFGYVDLKHGATHWLTLGGGVEAERDTTGTHFRPYGSVSVAQLSGLALQLQAARSAFTRATLMYWTEGAVNGSVTGGVEYPRFAQPTFAAALTPRWYLEPVVVARRTSGVPRLHGVSLRARAEGPLSGGVDRWRGSLAFDLRRSNLAVEYESGWAGVQDAGELTLSGLHVVSSRAPRWLRDQGATAGVSLRRSGVESAQLGATFALAEATRLNVSGVWFSSRAAPALNLSVNRYGGIARTLARITAFPDRVVSTVTADGALTYDRSLGVVPVGFGGTGTAGAKGRVFLDEDGDGRFGPGDRPVPGVEVLVGGRRTATDSAGVYHAWNVTPYERLEVALDTLRGIDPSWTPTRPSTVVRLTPHMYTPVDVPLIETRELSGTLVPHGEVPTAGGVTLEIRELATGTTTSTSTFSDGDFYVSRIRPGEYELRVAESSLRVLSAVSEPEAVRFTVSARAGEILVELPPIHLRPRPQ